MIRYIFLLGIICISSGLAMAQEDVSGFFMRNTFQRSHYNPALFPDSTINIAVANVSTSGFTNGDNIFASTTTNALGETVIDLNSIERKDVDSYGFADIGSLEFSLMLGDKWYMSIGHRIEADAYAGLTEDFINLAIDGNAPYLGEQLNLDPTFGATGYQSLYFGVGRRFSKLDVGVRLSYLSGIGHAGTSANKLGLTTSTEFYQLMFDNDFVINTSGGGVDYNGLDDITTDFESAGFGVNTGFGIDLGLNYRATEKLSISASIIDLGNIEWTDSPQTFSSQGNINYDGIDISDYIDNDIEIELTDSISDLLQIVETNNAFTTNLSSSIIVGADYQISDKYTIGGMLRFQNVYERNLTTIALSGSSRVFSFLDLGLVYSIRTESAFNVGLHSVWRLGPVQLLLATDNLFGYDVSNAQRSHIRMGLGLQF